MSQWYQTHCYCTTRASAILLIDVCGVHRLVWRCCLDHIGVHRLVWRCCLDHNYWCPQACLTVLFRSCWCPQACLTVLFRSCWCPQACLTVLSDNKQCAQTPYLVSVMTGWRYGGGTQATIYMYLSGLAGRSVRREFSDATRPLFASGGEDWFLLATRKDLGDLQSLHVWHVGSRASRPDW